MIKAILLIFEPILTWEGIALKRKSFGQVFFLFLVPMIFLSEADVAAGLFFFGRRQEVVRTVSLSLRQAVIYGAIQLVLDFLVVCVGAKVVKSVAGTFHSRNSYTESFTLVASALSPLFLLHLLDAFPGTYPWATFGIGIGLSVTTLYHGVPRVLAPDPPQAFGIYVTSAALLGGLAATARLLSLLLLEHKVRSF